MNYRYRAQQAIEDAAALTIGTKALIAKLESRDRFVAALVEEIAWQLRRAAFDGARAATLHAANDAAEALDNVNMIPDTNVRRSAICETIIARGYIPKPLTLKGEL